MAIVLIIGGVITCFRPIFLSGCVITAITSISVLDMSVSSIGAANSGVPKNTIFISLILAELLLKNTCKMLIFCYNLLLNIRN